MSQEEQTWPESWDSFFEYLDLLRKSGIVNMFGASTYLEAEFDLGHSEAIKILTRWMKTFSQRHPDGDRN